VLSICTSHVLPRHSGVFIVFNIIRLSKHETITHNLDFRFFYMGVYLIKEKQRGVL